MQLHGLRGGWVGERGGWEQGESTRKKEGERKRDEDLGENWDEDWITRTMRGDETRR